MEVMGKTADYSKSLLFNSSNNSVEQLNSIIAKFVGGKRVNFCLKRSYQSRCHAAVVSHNSKSPLYALYKSMFNKSPGNVCKLWQKRQSSKREKNNENRAKKNVAVYSWEIMIATNTMVRKHRNPI